MIEPTKLEVDEYIAGILGEYVAKSLIREAPTWFWGPGWPPAYYPGLKRILIPDIVADFWIINREVTKLALRFGLGHEFIHYIHDIRRSPFLTFPRVEEKLADVQGFRLSGISTTHGMQLWQRLFYEAEKTERKILRPAESSSPQKFYDVKYIDLSTGESYHKVISEEEQFDLYAKQREGKISVIDIKPIE